MHCIKQNMIFVLHFWNKKRSRMLFLVILLSIQAQPHIHFSARNTMSSITTCDQPHYEARTLHQIRSRKRDSWQSMWHKRAQESRQYHLCLTLPFKGWTIWHRWGRIGKQCWRTSKQSWMILHRFSWWEIDYMCYSFHDIIIQQPHFLGNAYFPFF